MRETWLTASVLVGAVVAGCGTANGEIANCGAPVADNHMTLVAVDAVTGDLVWSHEGLRPYANGYTHLEDSVVVVSLGGQGEAFDLQSGESVDVDMDLMPPFDTPTTDETDIEAVVVEGRGESANGDLVGHDPGTGAVRWTRSLDRPNHSVPLVRDGLVVISTSEPSPACG